MPGPAVLGVWLLGWYFMIEVTCPQCSAHLSVEGPSCTRVQCSRCSGAFAVSECKNLVGAVFCKCPHCNNSVQLEPHEVEHGCAVCVGCKRGFALPEAKDMVVKSVASY